MCHQVHSGLRGFARALIEVAIFIRVRVGSLRLVYFSPGSFGFLWIQSDASRGNGCSIGYVRARLGVVWIIRCCVGTLGHT